MKNDGTYNYEEIISTITDEEIIAYLKQNCEMDDKYVEMQMGKFKQHNDIFEEFKYAYFGMKHRDMEADILCFAVNEPVTEQGYTAYSLYHEFGDNIMPIGIFNLLISLREDKEETLYYIKECLPHKKFKAIMFLSDCWQLAEEKFKNPFYEEGEEKLQKKNIKKLEKQKKKRLKKIKKEDFNEENPFAQKE